MCKGTVFEKTRCPACDGFSRIEGNSIFCSRAEAGLVEVTLKQAQVCDGTKPIYERQEKHFLPLRRPAEKPVQETVSV